MDCNCLISFWPCKGFSRPFGQIYKSGSMKGICKVSRDYFQHQREACLCCSHSAGWQRKVQLQCLQHSEPYCRCCGAAWPWGCGCHTALAWLWWTNPWLWRKVPQKRQLPPSASQLSLRRLNPPTALGVSHFPLSALPSFHTSQSTYFASRHHRAYPVGLPAGVDLQCCWCWIVTAYGKSLFCTWGSLFS